MIGYRDRNHDGGHTVALDGMLLEFGPVDGVLWSPTPVQESVMAVTALRRHRFIRVEIPDRVAAAADEMPVGAETEQPDERPAPDVDSEEYDG